MKVNIRFFFYLLVLCLYSCHSKIEYRDFIDLSDITDYEDNKPSLLRLAGDYENVVIEEKGDLITENFICYNIKNPEKNIFGKIMHPSEYPLYIIMESDSIVSLFSNDEICKVLKESKKEQLRYNLLHSKFNIKADIKYYNMLLKLYYYVNNQDYSSNMDVNYLDSVIKKRSTFYGKYLLAQFYKGINNMKAEEIYNSLWINSTSKEMQRYPEEFMDILKNKNRINLVKKEDIKFVYTEYDFGRISPFEKVNCKFYFTNNSDKKYIIHNVTTTCGCTVASWNRKPINPSDQDSISVDFISKGGGINQKTIIIESNCKHKIELKVKAFVE